MKNYNNERQNKKYKRKHSKKKVTPVPMMMPMNPQPMIYQNPMIVQPQPMQPKEPNSPSISNDAANDSTTDGASTLCCCPYWPTKISSNSSDKKCSCYDSY